MFGLLRSMLLVSMLFAVVPYSASSQEDAVFLADIRAGTCDDLPEAITAELTPAPLPTGPELGDTDENPVATSFASVPVSLTALTDSSHVVIITSGDEVVACGAIGGRLNDAGALVIAIAEQGNSGTSGIAYVVSNAADPGQTDISLFVAGEPEPSTITQPAVVQESGPTPTPTFDQLVADYAPLADVRELAIRPGGLYGQKLIFSGTILTIQVAPEGDAFIPGNADPRSFTAIIQVTVPAPDGTTEVISVGYNGDTTGMFEGTWVTVYGTPFDTRSGTNMMGGEITQTLVDAEYVLIG
jgi:hypothetical protein